MGYNTNVTLEVCANVRHYANFSKISNLPSQHKSHLMLRLVEWILGRMKKRKRKVRKLLESVCLGGEEGKMIVGLGFFLIGLAKKFSLQIGKKTR